MSTTYSGQAIELGHLVADVDMNSHQYKFVTTASTAGSFKLGTGGSNPTPLGVLQNDPRSGEPGEIRILGSTKVAASGAIGFGDFVVCGSNAFAIAQSGTGSAPAMGIALTAITSGSGYIECLLTPGAQSLADNTP